MVAQLEPVGGDGPGGPKNRDREHVVIAYPGYHRPWAAWIGHQLERHGYRGTPQRWDPSREQPLEEALGDLLLAKGRVLLVLSDRFFELGPRTETEWNIVLRGFVAEHADRFAAVNLTNRSLLPATAVLEPVDLWSIGEEEAVRRLLARLDFTPRRSPLRLPDAPGARYPNDPSAVWGEVPRRNGQFTGRDELLNSVQQKLMDAGPGMGVCSLVGMSGIGKTQLAVEYAHRFSPDYDVVWWVNSDQRNTQRDRFGELAAALGLSAGSEPGERIRAVREALRKGDPYNRWLIIFDGWEETDEVASYLPQSGNGHVLITSRNRAWARKSDLIDVVGFRRAESTAYLMRRAPHISAPEADEVAAEFDDMPLQLAQAAAWLGESGMEAAEYLRMVHQGHLSSLDSAAPDDYPRSSLTSWSILLNKLRQTEPRTVELLTLCTSFAPGRIPLGLVRGLPAAELPGSLRWITSDLPGWARALDSLVNYSVLTRESRSSASNEPGPEQESVHMHRVAHGIVHELTANDDRETYREVARRLLAEADPNAPGDSRQWSRYAELLPHLEPSGVLESTGRRGQELLLNCLRYCHASGEYRVGAELAQQIRDHWSRFLGPQHRSMLRLTTLQGNILRAAGRFREAYELDYARLDRLRAALEATGGTARSTSDDSDGTDGADGADEEALMNAISCLAADQRFLGQYRTALEMQEEVLSSARRLLGEEEWTTLLARHNYGVGLRLLGRYQEAYSVDLDTFRKRETLLRQRHTDTLISGNTCARDLRLLGRYQDALARQELGLRLHVQVLGAQHPQTLSARHNLVLCERRAGTGRGGDLGEAMAALLEAHERTHGRAHFFTLALLTDYSSYLREHGDLAEARDLVTEAENGYRGLLGPAHPVPTGMQSNSGLILQAEGDREGALNMFEQALVGLRTLLGDDHPAALGCALNTAGGRNLVGQLEDAADLSRDTLRRSRHMLGDDHPLTLSAQVALAADLRGLRERTEAGKLEDDALQRLTRSQGAQHQHTLNARQRVRPFWDFEPYLG